MAGVIVLDADVLIAHFDPSDKHHERASRFLLSATGDSLGASTITLAEVLVGPARVGQLDRARNAVLQLQIQIIGLLVDDNASVRLAQIRADTNLKMPDCCVLLAAEQAGATLATFDERLASTARSRGLLVAG